MVLCAERSAHRVGTMAAMEEPMCDPVYVTARALPYFNGPPNKLDMLMAAEVAYGKMNIKGAK